MTANIAFASTNYGPMWAPVVSSWLRLIGYTSRFMAVEQIGKVGGAGVTDRMYTMTAENRVVKEMLEQDPTFTHLFMTESDMILPHDAITKLLELDKDMVSGVYFLRSDNPELRGQPCLYKKSFGKDYKYKDNPTADYLHAPVSIFPQDRPFRVDVAGLGCVLIKRKVFEVLPYPWFDLKAGTDTVNALGYGSDMYFYTHARNHGFELWCDPTVQCGQVDYYETTIADYHWQLENNPGFRKYGFLIGMA